MRGIERYGTRTNAVGVAYNDDELLAVRKCTTDLDAEVAKAIIE